MIPFGPSAEPMPIERSWPLIAAVCIVTVAFVIILGRNVRFAPENSRQTEKLFDSFQEIHRMNRLGEEFKMMAMCARVLQHLGSGSLAGKQ
jgi:hypothetical protein